MYHLRSFENIFTLSFISTYNTRKNGPSKALSCVNIFYIGIFSHKSRNVSLYFLLGNILPNSKSVRERALLNLLSWVGPSAFRIVLLPTFTKVKALFLSGWFTAQVRNVRIRRDLFNTLNCVLFHPFFFVYFVNL